jgi:hypothetical protein
MTLRNRRSLPVEAIFPVAAWTRFALLFGQPPPISPLAGADRPNAIALVRLCTRHTGKDIDVIMDEINKNMQIKLVEDELF